MRSIEAIIVIGSGNWGLTLAALFSKNRPTRVWTIDAAMAKHLNENRSGPSPIDPRPIPVSMIVEEKYATDFDPHRTLVVLAVPSGQVRTVAKELGQHAVRPLVLSVSKGFDAEQQRTMSEVIRNEIPGASVVVLTGPTIANEVAQGKPTKAVLACEDLMHLALVKDTLRNDVISFEVSRNPQHHEICAALKGIVAIAAGLAEGLELGANVQGVLMTEGLKELAAVASFFGIPESVAFGISGAADLITTCISPDSRNRRLGMLLAKGRTLPQALDEVRMTVEGVAMSQTIETLWALDVSIPLFHMVNAILRGRRCDLRREIAGLIASI
jgi:glycerol-3-phosphate dehydrogenase (NAD(P)+)